MNEKLEFVQRSINFSKEVLEKADLIVNKRLIPGITNRSGLVEYALRKVFQEIPELKAEKENAVQ